ncbi:MAG: membrane protein insertase YidC [Bdellovibrionales bacterium]|nr:membrane protein insertase YidC [Bdellovibrionales bacterium]
MENTAHNNHRKAFALFAVLILAVLYKQSVWDPFFLPQQQRGTQATSGENAAQTPAAPATMQTAQMQAQPAQPTSSSDTAANAEDQSANGMPTDAAIERGGFITLATDDLVLNISLLGGRISEYLLVNYLEKQGDDQSMFNLVSHQEPEPLPLGVYTGGVDDSFVQYSIVGDNLGESLRISGSEQAEIVLSGLLPDGRTITKAIGISGKGYLVDVAVTLSAPAADGSRLQLEWTKLITKDESSLLDPYNITGFTWFDDQKANRKPVAELKEDSMQLGEVRWASVSNKYFTASVISPNNKTPARVLKTGEDYRIRLAGSSTEGMFRLYTGPKSLEVLEAAGYDLDRNINFGWTGFVAAPLLMLLHFFYGLIGNYGLAIVLLTILVKVVLYPLNAASFKQMKAMQDLQPEVKRLRETVKDKQQQQLELMALYKKRNVNPLGGCLPMLVQMPIFIGLYSALLLAVELRHAPFALWVHDLSVKERLMMGDIGIPVMVILMVASMLVQQWITPSSADPAQKKMMMVMPIVFGFIFVNFPAGLTLYWLTNNLLSIAQQQALYKGGARFSLKVTVLTSAALFGFFSLLVAIS